MLATHRMFLCGPVCPSRPNRTLTDLRDVRVSEMAIFTPGGGIAAVSGSIGGTTFSRNRGGAYMRLRAIPINPNTVYQQAVRTLVGTLTSRWLDVLTPEQRAAWDTYALNVELPNPLGQPRNVGGLGMFVRSNVPRLQASPTDLPRIDDAPTIFNLGEYTSPNLLSASEATQTADVTFDNTDEWANEDSSGLLIYGSRARNPSINYFKGPYRLAGYVEGNGTTPPTSPISLEWPFPFTVGQRLFMMVRVSRADGRLSTPFRDWAVAVG